MTLPKPTNQPPARIVPVLFSAFVGYIERTLKKQFHAVRLVHNAGPPEVPKDRALVVFLNHASWWDPLLMMWLGSRCFPGREQFGPIDAEQLKRYGFFKYLGVFGVEKGTAAGARTFLRTSQALLARPGAMLWLTPQGRFADVRERPVQFAAGLAHLAVRLPEATFVPLSLEYAFGQERLPEIFVRFGSALSGADLGGEAGSAQAVLERALEANQEALAAVVQARDQARCQTLVEGGGGASVPYDLWRRLKAFLRRERLALNHSSVP